MEYLFVYGTLKRGYGLHSYLMSCNYIGKGETSKQFSLIDGTHFPFLVKRDGDGAIGELYHTPKYVIDLLDKVEGHPNFYKREKRIITVNDKDFEELRDLLL